MKLPGVLVPPRSDQRVVSFPDCIQNILFRFLPVTRDGYPVKTWVGLTSMAGCFTGVSLVPSPCAE